MQKLVKMISVILILGMVMATNVYSDAVDNIEIKAIEKITVDVEKNILHLTVKIMNANNKPIKFEKGEFIFSMGVKYDRAKGKGENEKKIGVDADFKSSTLPANSESSVEFNVDMGTESLNILAHIMNCIGSPKPKTEGNSPIFVVIDGKFELGMKDSKGWTTARDLGIKWTFIQM